MAGLLLYEIVLMGLGILMFLAVLSILVVYAIQGKPFRSLIWFFIIPVVMIAYPSFQSMRFKDWKVDLKEKAKELEKNPNDTAAAKAITEQLEKINPARIEDNADLLVTAAEAQKTTGNLDKAKETIQKAVKIKPNAPEIKKAEKDIQQKIEVKDKFQKDIRALNDGLDKIEKNPADTKTTTATNEILTKIVVPEYCDGKDKLVLVRAQAALGKAEEAKKTLDEAAKNNPEIQESGTKIIEMARQKYQNYNKVIVPAKPSDIPMDKSKVSPKLKNQKLK